MGASRQDFQAIAKAIDWVYSKIDGKDFANRTKKEVGKLVAEEIAEQISDYYVSNHPTFSYDLFIRDALKYDEGYATVRRVF